VNHGCSIDAEWIMEKKDWRQAVRQEKAAAATANGTNDANAYQPGMDDMKCLLWAHGGSFHFDVRALPPFLCYFIGGYYFGSVDQER
jgi:hypothetical protein